MIYTVFSHDESHPLRDFPTYAEAQEYGDKAFGPNQYEIEVTSGECLQKINDQKWRCSMQYEKRILDEPLILEPDDWNKSEWQTICRLFGMKAADRIVVSSCLLETYGEKAT